MIIVTDVSPRDGLQNEPEILTVEAKIGLIEHLIAAGVARIELGSFVNPKQVPQMAGTAAVAAALLQRAAQNTQFVALIPNVRGYDDASSAGLRHVRMVISASESLNQANFKHSVAASVADCATIGLRAKQDGIRFGVAIAASFGCPFEGYVAPTRVHELARQLLDLGADEIMLADTTGMAVPTQVFSLCRQVLDLIQDAHIEVVAHFHNTRNSGYANAYAALQAGITSFDASLGGIGGCPFAPHAVGNIATEDFVHMLNGMGYETSIDLNRLLAASTWLGQQLDKTLPALLGKAQPVYERVNAER